MATVILDCTLRDGGYINNWAFNEEQITNILSSLDNAKIEIIECGYLNSKENHKKDSTLFSNTEILDQYLKPLSQNSLYVVMINYGDYDPSLLPHCDDTKIKGIRLAFHKKNMYDVVEQAKDIISKGYKLFFQPMLTELYDDSELAELLRISNEIKPYAAYIVDSFGSMQSDTLSKLLDVYDKQLDSTVAIGFHAHNNLQLAFSNSINFLESNVNRQLIVDSSIYGMGRGAGNLNTELIATYLNNKRYRYEITPLLEVVDNHLDAIYRETYWGYSAGYYLSAIMKIHPNYARHLINKKSLTVASIQTILKMIDSSKNNSFDAQYIESLYESYNASLRGQESNTEIHFDSDTVLIVASGSSVKSCQQEINAFIKRSKPIVVSVNHVDSFIKSDYFFFSNEKRYIEFQAKLTDNMNILVTSNIQADNRKITSVAFDKLYNYKNLASSNVSILLLNLLSLNGVKKVAIAGLDGFNINTLNNYSYSESGRILERDFLQRENIVIQNAIGVLRKSLDINFITPSIFDKEENVKN